MTIETHAKVRAALIEKMNADHPDWTEDQINEQLKQTALGRGQYVEALHELLRAL